MNYQIFIPARLSRNPHPLVLYPSPTKLESNILFSTWSIQNRKTDFSSIVRGQKLHGIASGERTEEEKTWSIKCETCINTSVDMLIYNLNGIFCSLLVMSYMTRLSLRCVLVSLTKPKTTITWTHIFSYVYR